MKPKTFHRSFLTVALLSAAMPTGCRAVLSLLEREVKEVPAALKTPGVLTGAGFLSKREFFRDAELGTVTDVVVATTETAKPVIAMVGTRGARFLDSTSAVKSRVTFMYSAAHVDLIDVEGDGHYEFLNRGGVGWSDASLIDSAGRTVWVRGGGVDDMAAGDLDGDGELEFVVGFNGGDGIWLLDRRGQTKWRQSDSNVWHVELLDTRGDSRPEILHSNAEGVLTVRDGQGSVVDRKRVEEYLSDFSLCPWPTRRDPKRVLLPSDEAFLLIDPSGETVARFKAPHTNRFGSARGTPIKLKQGEPAHLAIVVEFVLWDRSVLYIFDSAKTLAYQEVLEGKWASLGAFTSGDTETLLLGGEDGTLYEYRADGPPAK